VEAHLERCEYGAPRIDVADRRRLVVDVADRACSRVWSNAGAPSSPTSSFGVNSSSIPRAAGSRASTRRVASSIAATADLLSAPRIVPPALRTTPSSITGSIGPSGGTVSRCAQRKIGVPPPLAARLTRQYRFPMFEPTAAPASVLVDGEGRGRAR
jgi:hypothetical protein